MLHHQIHRHNDTSEWIVLIHGAGGSSNVWYRQVRAFSRGYNLLLIDLRGHGLSAMQHKQRTQEQGGEVYTFTNLAQDVTEVLDCYGLKQAHFIGLSLGTIIIREIAEIDPSYIKSMIMAGAILRLDFRTRMLSRIASFLKSCIPYMTLYKIYAYLIMPRPEHRKSRMIFINNAIKITHNEFLNWMTLNKNINQLLNFYNATEPAIPTLYIMGGNDYIFLSQVRMQLSKHHAHSSLHVIPEAGHICNIDSSEEFNKISLDFIGKHA